ncbi:GFA family protein [Sphingomonas adhaesiva]|uniref:GFA family protein n=1 Tax=Sphingomonas adhaesiva TaxID=28212 RepID=UPI002FF4D2DB
MTTRVARCRCGQLTATCRADPVRVSICHCQSCQRRTGGPFAAQARFPAASVEVAGEHRTWERIADSGRRAWYRWCPDCGGTVFYTNEGQDAFVAVPIGAFADGDLPYPTASIFERRKQSWLEVTGEGITHDE